MIWRLRSRSRTICLCLALASACLYLLLLLASQSLHLQPCDTLLPPHTQFLRDLAGGSVSSEGVKEPADEPQRDPSSGDASGKAWAPQGAGRDGTETPESVESGLAKLEALFNHPLYNLPQTPIPEEDLLLRVRAKVTSSVRSSQMWSVIKKKQKER